MAFRPGPSVGQTRIRARCPPNTHTKTLFASLLSTAYRPPALQMNYALLDGVLDQVAPIVQVEFVHDFRAVVLNCLDAEM